MSRDLPYGLLAEFDGATALAEATRQCVAHGYRQLEAFMPFPAEEVIAALPPRRDRVPLITLLGGIAGGAGAYFMQWYTATRAYPINVGGRPLHSWPAFIPITFELTVLGAVLAAVIGMLVLNGLPRLRHPLFAAPGFDCASRNRFFLCVRGGDPLFDATGTAQWLRSLGAQAVTGVEP